MSDIAAREVWITGIGLVSPRGEGAAVHLEALGGGGAPPTDETRFAPFPVHPAPELNFDLQIPKKSDQRQMEAWQRLGVYGAGAALDAAGLKGDAEALGRLNVIVAAGGGERDYAVDAQILTGLRGANDPGAFLNERLMGDLRPTLFLAQLSNLLAGNISIVHGVTGGTRTFMGEEQAGVDAVRVAHARIAADQGDLFLVGGSYNAERPDSLLIFEMGGLLWKRPYAPVWDRPGEGGGFVLGSGAAFLVLEERGHAQRRGVAPLARLVSVAADQPRRKAGSVGSSLEHLWATAAPRFSPTRGAIFSGATGISGMTEEELGALVKLAQRATIHATGNVTGHMVEAQFPASIAMAAAAIREGLIEEAAATSVGHRRGEGLAYLVRAE